MACPLEKPACKRKIMASNKPYEKQQCPLNIKPKCVLSQPACPLLNQEENKCGYAKLMGEEEDVDNCPCKTCCLSEGCPLTLNIPEITPQNNSEAKSKPTPKWPKNMPPCVECKQDEKEYNGGKAAVEKVAKKPAEKPSNKSNDNINVKKATMGAPPRPLPCAECLFKDLNNSSGDKNKKDCLYLSLPDKCCENCYCPNVPSVEVGPECPFLPKPCPCCKTPRCPLSRKPDCILQPKPLCCLFKPPCCPLKPSLLPCPTFSSCPLNPDSSPCCCGKCTPCDPCITPKPPCPPCIPSMPCSPCAPCMPCSPCAPCMLCSSCAPCIPCSPCDPCMPCSPCAPCIPCSPCDPCMPCSPCAPCIPCSPCSPCVPCPPSLPCPPCSPLVTCPPCSPLSCPLAEQGCSNPCCIPCLIKKVECALNPLCCPLKLICPPIPPPCSLRKDNDKTKSNEDKKEEADRTFHFPTCPSYDPPCEMHQKLENDCPFSPDPCPVGPECPFPVTLSIAENNVKDQKGVKLNGTKNLNNTKKEKQLGSAGTKNKNPKVDSGCPFSPACGTVPLPECPAAEILSPDKYIPPKKVEKKICPYKKCMDREGCPLGKLKPNVDCPLGNAPDCPLMEDPECPIVELRKRCSLYPFCSDKCACSISCKKPCQPCKCACTRTDGCSHPNLPLECSEELSVSSTNVTSSSNSITNSLTVSSDSESILKECNISSSSLNNIKNPSTLNIEKLQLDGPNKKKKGLKIHSTKSSSSFECPFEPLAPKRVCPLAPPKCPLTPKPKSCPLTRKPDPCCLSGGGELICPVQYPSCKKFPKGRCPMGNLNMCDCEYPISPCLLPLQDPSVIAPKQYCFREDCCMGLPYPPVVAKNVEGGEEEGPFYSFKNTKPGKEETKYYVSKSDKLPTEGIFLFGNPRERIHDNWTIVKNGEGYLRCKTIAEKLKNMGPINNQESQYDSVDCPIDEETRIVLENRKKHEREEKEIERMKESLGLLDAAKKTKKKKRKNK